MMFKFKGISNLDMNVIPEEEDFKAKAQRVVETIVVDGRDGNIYNELGYANIDLSLKLSIMNQDKMDDILAWLNGSGEFEYDGRTTFAYFYTNIIPKRISSIKTIECTFVRDPFWYKVNDEFIEITNNVINEGNIASRPIIKLIKNSEKNVDISISNIRFQYIFSDDEDYVEIDCKEMKATYENLLRNRNLSIGYEFPKIYPGENEVIIHSGDPTVFIKRKDCYL